MTITVRVKDLELIKDTMGMVGASARFQQHAIEALLEIGTAISFGESSLIEVKRSALTDKHKELLDNNDSAYATAAISNILESK